MQFSDFGQHFTRESAILQLMDDLGKALAQEGVNMLGGGNPARIPAVNALFAEVLRDIANGDDCAAAVENIGNYSEPQGDRAFLNTVAAFLRRHYGWSVSAENLALTNGSQNAFFYLFNLFGGAFTDNQGNTVQKSVLLPLAPEYVGYADVQVGGSRFVSVPPQIENVQYGGRDGFFKYRIDFDALEKLPQWAAGEIGAVCCSRPTNPSGNVLTDAEMARLDALARRHGVPLIIDNAYGMPFPNIIHRDAELVWHDNIILCFSLSKVGLPGVRCGIVLARPEVIRAITALNAVVNLAPTRFGAAVAAPLLQDDRLKTLADNVIRPFYRRQADLAVSLLQKEMADLPVRIHLPEGAIFLWLWFEGLPAGSDELYRRLKARGTLVIPSEPFFVGIDTAQFCHARECVRISIAQDQAVLARGIAAIAAEARALYGTG
ncbi:valine--pyruvate transaminase [Conchiformibius kuhniae]|uniref:Putative 8-amino-7-oxononanoate synthase n=1 Tax=Conchiformibius kuhniae TaxID=211502 RepID=A0A8T9MUC7_9NEIS|nr:valine--pyruvate transaminase [Conchiformibius kuhniae]UOP04889.1 valine--pyruvate transaminase [Conchiformibius kuhniae]